MNIKFLKFLFSFLICFVSTALLFSAEKKTNENTFPEPAIAVFTGEEYSIYVSYTNTVYPGDAICVRIEFSPSRKISKEPYSRTQAVLLFGEKRKADFFTLNSSKIKQNGNVTIDMLGMIPISTWQEKGNYELTIMYSAYGRDFYKFNLPIEVKPKEFISETIELNESNTSIRTDTSSTKMNQINKLNNILFSINQEAIYQTKPFSLPTTESRRTSFFGDRRVYAYSNGKSSTTLHYGIDFGIPTGTPVFSCGKGRVVMAENRISTGWTVVIEHLPGLYSLYYHMDSLLVEVGDFVEQEKQIGFSGATGLATGPHLHWEVRLNGEAVNPDFFTGDFPFFN